MNYFNIKAVLLSMIMATSSFASNNPLEENNEKSFVTQATVMRLLSLTSLSLG